MDIVLEKQIEKSAEDVYNALTDPVLLSVWFTKNAKCELQPGGRYENDDKDEGVFLELIPFKRIRFTWDNKEHCPGTEVDIQLIEEYNIKTKITLRHLKLKSEKDCAEMKEGWTWALTSLKSFLETGKPVRYNE